MRPLTVIPERHRHVRRQATTARLWHRARGIGENAGAFTPLIDARAAGRLLGVPHTWLLEQARAGRIPHHRLGHYVRFSAHDLARWLEETRRGPCGDGSGASR